MSALSIRRDRIAAVLRKLARMESDARIARRILAIANALDGMSRDEAVDLAYRWEPSVGAGKDGEYLFIAQHIARANDHDTAQLTPKLPKGIRVTNNGALTRPAPFSLAS
jgi:hypothetical protein